MTAPFHSFHLPIAASSTALAEAASTMMTVATAAASLAEALADFEASTGRKLLVSEAGGAIQTPVDLRDAAIRQGAELGLQFEATTDEANGIAIENDAQPIDTGSTKTVTEPETARDEPTAAVTRAAASSPSRAPVEDRVRRSGWAALSLTERRIVKHIERLPGGDADADVHLVELLTTGNKIDVVAAFLEVEPQVALDRWKSFLTEDVVGVNGKPTIDGQARLLKALRYIRDAANA